MYTVKRLVFFVGSATEIRIWNHMCWPWICCLGQDLVRRRQQSLWSALSTSSWVRLKVSCVRLWYVSCITWRHGSVVRTSVSDWQTFPDMRLIYGWCVTTSWVRRLLWVNQPGQLSLLPSVGWGMSNILVARWVILLAAVSPSSECLYKGKADVVYLQVTLCDPHLSA